MSGKIHRVKRESDYAIFDTWALRAPHLSWKAKGLHSYIQQLPTDWELNIADLKERSSDGRDGTSSGVQELIEAGLLLRFQCFNSSGLFNGYDYHCFERPEEAQAWLLENGKTVNGKTVNGFPVNGGTVNGKPVTSNNEDKQVRSQLKTKTTKNEKGADLFAETETGSEFGEALTEKKKKARKKSAAYSEVDVANEMEAAVHIFYAELLNLGLWQKYVEYRSAEHSFKYKRAASQAAAVANLYELSGSDVLKADKIITQTIANGWKGLFALKNTNNGQFNGNGNNGNGATPEGGSGFFGGGSQEFFTGVK